MSLKPIDTKGIEHTAASQPAKGDVWSDQAAKAYAPGFQLAASQGERPSKMDPFLKPIPILEPLDGGQGSDDPIEYPLRLNGGMGDGGRWVPSRRGSS